MVNSYYIIILHMCSISFHLARSICAAKSIFSYAAPPPPQGWFFLRSPAPISSVNNVYAVFWRKLFTIITSLKVAKCIFFKRTLIIIIIVNYMLLYIYHYVFFIISSCPERSAISPATDASSRFRVFRGHFDGSRFSFEIVFRRYYVF